MMDLGPLLEVITQLGFAGLFLFLYLKERQESRLIIIEKDKQLQGERDKRDEAVRDMTTALIGIVREMSDSLQKNATVQEKLKTAVDNNTKVVERLTDRISPVNPTVELDKNPQE